MSPKKLFIVASVVALIAAITVGTFLFRRELDSVRQKRDAAAASAPRSVAPR